MDFADRLTFAATRSRRLALRHGVAALAARACITRALARRQCSAPQPSAMGAAAMPRALRSGREAQLEAASVAASYVAGEALRLGLARQVRHRDHTITQVLTAAGRQRIAG